MVQVVMLYIYMSLSPLSSFKIGESFQDGCLVLLLNGLLVWTGPLAGWSFFSKVFIDNVDFHDSQKTQNKSKLIKNGHKNELNDVSFN